MKYIDLVKSYISIYYLFSDLCIIRLSIIKTKILLSQACKDDFGYPGLDLWFYFSQRLNFFLAFQSYVFERTWRGLYQKRVVRTKFDINVFIIFFYYDMYHMSNFQCQIFTSYFNL